LTRIQSRERVEPPRESLSDVEEQKEDYSCYREMSRICLQLNGAGEDQTHEDCRRCADTAESALQNKRHRFDRVAIKTQATTNRQVTLEVQDNERRDKKSDSRSNSIEFADTSRYLELVVDDAGNESVGKDLEPVRDKKK